MAPFDPSSPPVEDPADVRGGLVVQGVSGTRLIAEQSVLKNQFSVCALAKYNGNTRRRVVSSSDVNNIFGHYNGHSGVAHWNGWRTISSTQPSPIVEDRDDWLVYCGSEGTESHPDNHWVNGNAVGTGTGAGNLGRFGVNAHSETSDFAVRQLLVWDVALNADQLKAASDCLLQVRDGREERLCYGQADISDGSFCDSVPGLSTGGLVAGFMGGEPSCIQGMTLVPAAGNESARCEFDSVAAGSIPSLAGGFFEALAELDFATALDVLGVPDSTDVVELNAKSGWVHVGPKGVPLDDRAGVIAALAPAYERAHSGVRSQFRVRVAPAGSPEILRLVIYGYAVSLAQIDVFEVLPDGSRLHFLTVNDDGLSNAPTSMVDTNLGYQRIKEEPFAEYLSWSWFLQTFDGVVGTTDGILEEEHGRIENKQSLTYLDARLAPGFSGTALKVPATPAGTSAQWAISYNNVAPLRAGGFTHLAVTFWARHEQQSGYTSFMHFNNQAFSFYYQDNDDCTGFTIRVSGTWGWTPHVRKCAPFPEGTSRTEWHHVALSVYGDRGYYARNFQYILMVNGKRTYFTRSENTQIPWFQCLGVTHAWGMKCAYGDKGYAFQSTDHTYYIDEFETYLTALDEARLLAMYQNYKPSILQRRINVDTPRAGKVDIEVRLDTGINGTVGLDLAARDALGNKLARPLDVSIGYQAFENAVAAPAGCAVGYYSVPLGDGAGNGCRECPVGATTLEEGSVDASACLCKPGFRQVAAGSASTAVQCEMCAPGSYKEAAGDSACLACPAGQPGLNGGLKHAGGCACLAGHVYNATSEACEVCRENHFCKGGEHEERCPERMRSDAGSVSESACSCAPGFYVDPTGGENGGPTCSPCAIDHFCLGGSADMAPCAHECGAGEFVLRFCHAEADTTCQPCSPGTAKNYTGNDFFTCPSCLPGSYEAEFGQAVCTACGEASFCPLPGMSAPVACPANSRIRSAANRRSSDIEDCQCVATLEREINGVRGALLEAPPAWSLREGCAGPAFNTSLCDDVCQPCRADAFCAGHDALPSPCPYATEPTLRDLEPGSLTTPGGLAASSAGGVGRLVPGPAAGGRMLMSLDHALYWLDADTGAHELLMPGSAAGAGAREDGTATGSGMLVGLMEAGSHTPAGVAAVPGSDLVVVGEVLASNLDTALRVINVATRSVSTLALEFSEHNPAGADRLRSTRSVACHEDQVRCFVHSEGNGNLIFQIMLSTGHAEHFAAPAQPVTHLGFGPNLQELRALTALSGGDKTVRRYALGTGGEDGSWVAEAQKHVGDIVFDSSVGDFAVYTRAAAGGEGGIEGCSAPMCGGMEVVAAHVPSEAVHVLATLAAGAGAESEDARPGGVPALLAMEAPTGPSSEDLRAASATLVIVRYGTGGALSVQRQPVIDAPVYASTTLNETAKHSPTQCFCPDGAFGFVGEVPYDFCKPCPDGSFCSVDRAAPRALNDVEQCPSPHMTTIGHSGTEGDCACDYGFEPQGDAGCSTCPAGHERPLASIDGSCTPCRGGFFSDHPSDRCDICPAGSFTMGEYMSDVVGQAQWHTDYLSFWMEIEPGSDDAAVHARRYEARQAPVYINPALERDDSVRAPMGHSALKVPAGSGAGMQWDNDQIWPRSTRFSLAFWLKLESTAVQPTLMTEQILWHLIVSTSANEYFPIFAMGGGGNTNFGGWTTSLRDLRSSLSADSLDLTEWHHFVFAKGGGNRVGDWHLIIDGVAYAYEHTHRGWFGSNWYDYAFPTNTIPLNSQIWSGFRNTPPTMLHRHSEGAYWIDDMRFYDGVTLDQTQAGMLMTENLRAPEGYVRDACLPCAKGFHQPRLGQMQCLPCAAGTYSSEKGATACADCAEGTVCGGGGEAQKKCVLDTVSSTNIADDTAGAAALSGRGGRFAELAGRVRSAFRGYNPERDSAAFGKGKITKIDTGGGKADSETECTPEGVGTGGKDAKGQCAPGFTTLGNGQCKLERAAPGKYKRYLPPRLEALPRFSAQTTYAPSKLARVTAKSGYMRVTPTSSFARADVAPSAEDQAGENIVADLGWDLALTEPVTVTMLIHALPRASIHLVSEASGEEVYSFDESELLQHQATDPRKVSSGVETSFDGPAGGVSVHIKVRGGGSEARRRALLQEAGDEVGGLGVNATVSFQAFQEGEVVEEECPISFFGQQDDTSNYCLECPANFSTALAGRTDINECMCAAGMHMVNGTDLLTGGECVPCPPSMFKDTVSNAHQCEPCPAASAPASLDFVGRNASAACYCGAGSLYDASAGACTACPEGSFCYGAHHQESCPLAPETTSAAGSKRPSDCACLDSAAEGLARYLDLSAGQYDAVCRVCPAGSFCPSGRGDDVHPCPAMSDSAQGSGAVTDCLCDPGSYGPPGGPCRECEAGFFCAGGLHRQACPQNSTSLAGSSEVAQCVCMPRFEDLANETGSGCTPCGEDFYCTGGIGPDSSLLEHRGPREQCPPLSTAAQGAAATVEDCQCSLGTFVDTSVDPPQCTQCQPGSVCDGSAVITPCPEGQSSDAGSHLLTHCSSVPGYYGPNGEDATPCFPGAFCPGGLEAVACPENTTSAPLARVEAHCVCLPGHYEASDTLACPACRADHYCTSVALGNSTPAEGVYAERGPMEACPALSSVGVGLGTSLRSCQCIKDTFLDTDTGECSQCPENLETRGIGAVGAAECGSKPGYYDPSGGLEPAHPCPNATFCAGFNTQPAPCVEFSNSSARSTSIHDCICKRTYFKATLESGEIICTQCNIGQWFVQETETCAACNYCAPGQHATTVCRGSVNSVCAFCEAGTFSNKANQPSCTSCPPRTYQDRSGKTSCRPCGDSFGCAAGSVEAELCPQGTFADLEVSQSGGCEPCSPGYYNLMEGQSHCLPAARTFFSPGFNATPAQCPVGTSTGGVELAASECVVCSAGTYGSVAGLIHCPQCPGGYGCSGGANKTICPAGTSAPPGSAQCAECGPGSYSDQEGSSQCDVCPQGVACAGGSAFEECAIGSVAPEGSSSCTVCPGGSYSTEERAGACLPCDAGYSCVGGDNHEICLQGFYSDAQSLTCTACPLLMTTAGNATAGIDGCGAAPGYYLLDNDVNNVPIPCPADHFCPGMTPLPIACPEHSTSPARAESIDDCACSEPYHRSAQDTCVLCDDNFFFSAEAGACEQCLQCIAGFSRDGCDADVDSTCNICLPGSFSPRSNSPECLLCAPGTFASRYASTSCRDCESGYGCPEGTSQPQLCGPGTHTQLQRRAHGCFPCPEGEFQPLSRSQFCKPAPRGHVPLPGAAAAEVCPAGTKANLPERATECVACPVGTYSPNAGRVDCLECPQGHVCLEEGTVTPEICRNGTSSAAGPGLPCETCAPGTVSLRDGESSCTECIAGTQCPGGSQRSVCGVGTAAPRGSASCTSCAAGSFSDERMLGECKPALPGHRAAGGSDHTPAPTGSYVSEDRTQFVPCALHRTTLGPASGDSVTDCVAAPGYYAPADGVTAPTLCPDNSFCPAGSTGPTPCMPHGSSAAGSTSIDNCTCTSPRFKTPENECIGCPASEFFDGEQCKKCTPCIAGFEIDRACGGPDGDQDQTCAACPAGSFAGSVNTPQCSLCPAGTYQQRLGRQNCLECPRGFGCPEGSVRPVLCLPGFETRKDEGATGCFECEAGTYAPLPQTIFCRDAEPGHISSVGATGTQACEAGTFANKPVRADACVEAPAGTYVALPAQTAAAACPAGHGCAPGTVTPSPCVAGTAAPAGSAACEPCPEGSFGDKERQAQCSVCPAGYECHGREHIAICQEGEFAAEGSPVCVIAPPGFYSNATGLAAALPCPFGHSCPGGAAVSVNPKGHYSNELRSEALACPALRTTAHDGAGWDITDCVAQPGYYAPPDGVSAPEPCPEAHYCGLGAVVPERCMDNATSDALSVAIDNCTCTGGLHKAHNHICTVCPEDLFMNAEGFCTECTSCPAGTFASRPCEGSLDAICQTCEAGSVTTRPDRAECTVCAAGSYSLLAGSTECSTCEPGWSCHGGSHHEQCQPGSSTGGILRGAHTCVQCAPGTHAAAAGMTDCRVCPEGTACPQGAVNTTTCPAGTAARARSSQCTDCEPGTYGLQPGLARCKQCEAGYACAGLAEREQCSVGYAAPAGSAQCTLCPPGAYSDERGLAACKPCPAGFSCRGGSDIKICRAGFAAAEESSECSVCTEGFFTQHEGAHACLPCGEGYVCKGGSSRSPCIPDESAQIEVTKTVSIEGKTGGEAAGRAAFRGYSPKEDAERFKNAGGSGDSSCPAAGLGTGGKTDNKECMEGMVYNAESDECELPEPPAGFYVEVVPPKLTPFPDPETAPVAEPGEEVASEAGFLNFDPAAASDDIDPIAERLNMSSASVSRFKIRLDEQVIFTIQPTDLQDTILIVSECKPAGADSGLNCSDPALELIKLTGELLFEQKIQSKSSAVDVVYIVPHDSAPADRRLLQIERMLLQDGQINMAWQQYSPPKIVNSTCPKDYYSVQDASGAIACVGCAEQTYTKYAASPQESYCQCEDGFFSSVRDFVATSAEHSLAERGSVDGPAGTARMWQSTGQITTSLDNAYALFAEPKGSCVVRAYHRPSGALSTVAGEAGQCTFSASAGSNLTFAAPTGVETHPYLNDTLYVVDAEAGVIVRAQVDWELARPVPGSAVVVAGTGDGSRETDLTLGGTPLQCSLRYPTGLRRVEGSLFTAVIDSAYSQYHVAIVKYNVHTGALSRQARLLSGYDRPTDIALFPYWFSWDIYGDEMFYQDFNYGRNVWVAYNYRSGALRTISPPFADVPSIKQLSYLTPVLPDVYLVTAHFKNSRPSTGSVMLYNETSGERTLITEPVYGMRQVYPTADRGEVLGVLYSYSQETGIVSVKMDRAQTCEPCSTGLNCSTGYAEASCFAPRDYDAICVPGTPVITHPTSPPAPVPVSMCACARVHVCACACVRARGRCSGRAPLSLPRSIKQTHNNVRVVNEPPDQFTGGSGLPPTHPLRESTAATICAQRLAPEATRALARSVAAGIAWPTAMNTTTRRPQRKSSTRSCMQSRHAEPCNGKQAGCGSCSGRFHRATS